MLETIKITMLAGPGAGKTCFMLGMYNVMRSGLGAFSFSSVDRDQDLDLSDLWFRLVKGGEERWPPPNIDRTDTFNFYFNYALDSIVKFSWLDYRGRALIEPEAAADVQELEEHLFKSSAVFLCISGEHFVDDKPLELVELDALTSRMTHFLTDAKREAGRLPPIVIMITKFDLCRHMAEDALLSKVKGLFEPLFAQGSNVLTTLVPVSLGIGLAGDPAGAVIEPKNVHLPVSFAVYQACKQALAEISADIRHQKEQTAELQGNLLKEWWNKRSIRLSEETRNTLEANRDQIEKMLSVLGQELVQGVKTYWNGERVELDV